MRIISGLLVLSALCLITGFQYPDFYSIPTFSGDQEVNAVIEIPAGTNTKIEYRPKTNSFLPDSVKGKLRKIEYLPYPGNYGFIPSTLMKKDKGGDGDALDILILGESRPTGTVIKVIPIAVLMLMDDGEKDDKIIAVPAAKSQRLLNVVSFNEMVRNHPEVQQSIENWFLNYKGKGAMLSKGWGNKQDALTLIRKWVK